MGRGGSTLDESSSLGGGQPPQSVSQNFNMLRIKKTSLGQYTNSTNGMDDYDEYNHETSMSLSKTINQSNNGGKGLKDASRFETIGDVRKQLRPSIPKPPTIDQQKAAIQDSTNHIKRILLECNVMRTRSKKYDGPNDNVH